MGPCPPLLSLAMYAPPTGRSVMRRTSLALPRPSSSSGRHSFAVNRSLVRSREIIVPCPRSSVGQIQNLLNKAFCIKMAYSAGMYWKTLPREEREVWEAKALVAQAEHRKRYPDWRFRPGANALAKLKVKDGPVTNKRRNSNSGGSTRKSKGDTAE